MSKTANIPATPTAITFRDRDLAWCQTDRGDADVTRIAHLVVYAGTYDEGPMSPAFYWSIENDAGDRITDGWHNTAHRARREAVREARRLLAERVTP